MNIINLYKYILMAKNLTHDRKVYIDMMLADIQYHVQHDTIDGKYYLNESRIQNQDHYHRNMEYLIIDNGKIYLCNDGGESTVISSRTPLSYIADILERL